MIPTLTAFLKTMTGKAALGLAVATMSVGAAAAAGAELPVLSPRADGPALVAAKPDPLESAGDESTEEESTAEESTEEESTEEESTEESTEDESTEEESTEEESTDETDDDETDDDLTDIAAAGADAAVVAHECDGGDDSGAGSVDGEADDTDACVFKNHGQMVSNYAHTTEFVGCERGQAVSAVARGLFDPATEAAALAEHVAQRCADKPDADDDDEADEATGDDAASDSTEVGDDDDDDGDELTAEERAAKDQAKADAKVARDETKSERKQDQADRKSDQAARTSSNGRGASNGKGKNG